MDIMKNFPLPYEPKKQNRWIINLPKDLGINDWVAYATDRPKLKFLYGKTYYEPLEIKFRDPIAPSTSQSLWSSIGKLNEGFDYTLELLEPTGEVVEKWKINGCVALSLDFGYLNYMSDTVVTCSLIVQPTVVLLEF